MKEYFARFLCSSPKDELQQEFCYLYKDFIKYLWYKRGELLWPISLELLMFFLLFPLCVSLLEQLLSLGNHFILSSTNSSMENQSIQKQGIFLLLVGRNMKSNDESDRSPFRTPIFFVVQMPIEYVSGLQSFPRWIFCFTKAPMHSKWRSRSQLLSDEILKDA